MPDHQESAQMLVYAHLGTNLKPGMRYVGTINDHCKGVRCLYNPLIGLTNTNIENLKSMFWGFPEGFEHFGPQIRIPREKLRI